MEHGTLGDKKSLLDLRRKTFLHGKIVELFCIFSVAFIDFLSLLTRETVSIILK